MVALLLNLVLIGNAYASEVAPDPSAEPSPPASASEQLIERVRAAQEEVSRIRGLSFKRDVMVEVETPTTMRESMREEMDERLADGELDTLVFVWSLLRLAPASLDLYEVYLGVLEDGVGGYYNAEKQRLVVVDREEVGLDTEKLRLQEDLVIAHELVHALQDQHFDLRSIHERELNNGDATLAVLSMIEGEANYAMLYRMLPNPDAVPLRSLGPALSNMTGASEEMSGRFAEAPRALTSPLVFPYIHGLIFAQELKLSGQGWGASNRAFSQPPLSTEQILHPEKYIGPDQDWPTLITFEEPDRWLGRRWELVDEDTLGEAGIRVLLREHHPDSDFEGAAEGWDGDRLLTWRRGDEGAQAWLTTWDSPEDAAQFAEATWELARVIHPDASWTRDALDSRGNSGRASHLIRIEGTEVLILLGVPRGRVKRALRKLGAATFTELTELDQLAPYEPQDPPTEAEP